LFDCFNTLAVVYGKVPETTTPAALRVSDPNLEAEQQVPPSVANRSTAPATPTTPVSQPPTASTTPHHYNGQHSTWDRPRAEPPPFHRTTATPAAVHHTAAPTAPSSPPAPQAPLISLSPRSSSSQLEAQLEAQLAPMTNHADSLPQQPLEEHSEPPLPPTPQSSVPLTLAQHPVTTAEVYQQLWAEYPQCGIVHLPLSGAPELR